MLPALCLTQITGWGIVSYAFPVLYSRITADTSWSSGATTGAFSPALLVSAAAGVPTGRVLDRRGPHPVMTAGSALAVIGVLAVAAAPNLPILHAAWALTGIAMAATFYQPAFAAVTRWWGPDRVRALTIVTLPAASPPPSSLPLTATLAEHLDWRTTYLVLACVLVAITLPAHGLALRAPGPPTPQPQHPEQPTGGGDRTTRSRPFALLATAFTHPPAAELLPLCRPPGLGQDRQAPQARRHGGERGRGPGAVRRVRRCLGREVSGDRESDTSVVGSVRRAPQGQAGSPWLTRR